MSLSRKIKQDKETHGLVVVVVDTIAMWKYAIGDQRVSGPLYGLRNTKKFEASVLASVNGIHEISLQRAWQMAIRPLDKVWIWTELGPSVLATRNTVRKRFDV